MLELLASGFLSFWLDKSEVQVMQSVDWSSWLNAAWIQSIGQPEAAPDPVAELVVRQHLGSLAPLGMEQAVQGVWIQAENQVVASHQGEVPLSAASLTKVATTLVALETWGPDHQFETAIGATGPIENGVLQGDLVVQGGGDPYFVWEEAIALGNALNQRGITRVTGNLVIAGNFIMNFETDGATAGALLKQGLNQTLWNQEASTQYQTLPQGTPRPQVAIAGSVQVVSAAELENLDVTPLVRHKSLPLVDILKAQNVFSNNVMSDMLANELGGAQTVAQTAARVARVPADQIQLINGSGLGMENRISPRAVSAMLVAIQRYLEPQQLNIGDLFPVIGRDRGTLRNRRIPTGSAVKTGTLNAVSSLAGVIPTRDRGLVWFAIINVGNADLGVLHNQQDILLQSLQQRWGAPSPLPSEITPGDRANRPTNRPGAADRNEIVS